LLDALDRLDEAREARQKAIGLAPGQLSFTQYLALLSNSFMTALQSGDLQTARSVYNTMQNMTPGSPLVRLYAAEIALAAGDVSVASADLTTLAGEAPEFQQVHAALITALLDKESFELALRQVDELLKASGENRRAAAARGPIRAAAAAAQGSVERAVAIASAQVLMGEPHIATRTLDAALVKYPDSADLAAGRIALDLQARRKSDALKRALALAESQPDKALALGMLAQAQVASREYGKAVDVYEQLWKVAPSADLAVALSRAKRDAKMSDSPEPMRRWLQTKPEDYAVRLLLADAEATAGNPDKAQVEYERILRDKPNTVIALNNLAIIYGQRNDPRALPMAKKAYGITPKAPVVADTYGWLLAQSGAVKEALPLLQAAVRDSPALPEMRYHLAEVLARNGDREGARSMVLEALRGDTDFFGRDAAIKLRDSLTKQ
jgi:predicted Zn-dependent protease